MCFRLWRRSALSQLALSVLGAERIFLTAWEGEALYTIAIDRETGSELWRPLRRQGRGSRTLLRGSALDGRAAACNRFRLPR